MDIAFRDFAEYFVYSTVDLNSERYALTDFATRCGVARLLPSLRSGASPDLFFSFLLAVGGIFVETVARFSDSKRYSRMSSQYMCEWLAMIMLQVFRNRWSVDSIN